MKKSKTSTEPAKGHTLIIGAGETGLALAEVLRSAHTVWVIDQRLHKVKIPQGVKMGDIDVMHVCIPPSATFESTVLFYQTQYKPRHTVIHASVPIGTSRRLGAFHSPIRGVHPKLAEGIRTFVKYLAPRDPWLTAYFEKAGIHVKQVDKPETTEALKLWDTTYYGWNIIFQKLLHRWCKEKGMDFETIYRDGNDSYNVGYAMLGRPEVIRPVLRYMEGSIGGHCVMENLELFDSPIGEFIKLHNEGFKMSKVSKAARPTRGRSVRRS